MANVIDPLTNAELEAWAQVLEGDNYEQGMGALCDGKKFCCLGVLANERGELDGRIFTRTGQGSDLAKGITGPDYYMPREVQYQLAKKNDRGETFTEIAQFIRTELIGRGGDA